MTTPDDAFSTLDDFLLSLADGVAQAQGELTRGGAMGPPGRQFLYHLPRVDFELKMNLRVVEDAGLSQRYRQFRRERNGDKHLLFKPLAADEVATSTLDVAAIIRGAFVAVPENNGLPAVVVSTGIVSTNPRAPVLVTTVRNAAGEALEGVEVQVNLDREESQLLTQAANQQFALSEGTGLANGVLLTDVNGRAETRLDIAVMQTPCLLAMVIDVGEQTFNLVYEVVKA